MEFIDDNSWKENLDLLLFDEFLKNAKQKLLLWLLRAEARWLAAPDRRLPFGHSLYALARRPGPDA